MHFNQSLVRCRSKGLLSVSLSISLSISLSLSLFLSLSLSSPPLLSLWVYVKQAGDKESLIK